MRFALKALLLTPALAAAAWSCGGTGTARGPSPEASRAARAYHSYQNCGLKAAQNLFANGW